MKGTVIKLFQDKGFGFILGENNLEYFFHSSAILNGKFINVKNGQIVDFEPNEGLKGPRAEDITL